MAGDGHIGDAALEALAAFAPSISDPDFDAGVFHGGEAGQMPWFEQSRALAGFVEAAIRHGLVLADFDWPAWRDGPDGARLLASREAIASASAADLACILTVLIRADRFVEGYLADCARSGLLGAVACRAGDILRDRR